jgi:uncharacterized protein (TIGR03000 family)
VGEAVVIDVHVPAQAEIWFDGQKTAQTGSDRRFISPPLAPGHDYSYQLRVRWVEGGSPVEQTRRLSVRAGDRINLDFPGGRYSERRSLSSGLGPTPRTPF